MLGRALVGKARSDIDDLGRALLDAAHAADPGFRVVSVIGPPQSGKSRALDEFVRNCSDGAFSLPLTEDDTTLFAFLSALVTCIGPIARGAQLSFNAMHMRFSTSDCIPHIVAWLRSHLNAGAWIAVDNVELLEPASPVAEFLLAMVERCPDVRWLFAGRNVDALPLGAWRNRGIATASFSTPPGEALSVTRLLARLSRSERELLAEVAPLRTLEPHLVDAILGESERPLVRRLYERVPALFEVNGSVRLHRDVRNALLEELTRRSEDILQSAVATCGTALEAFEQYEELLQMYLRNRAHRQLEDVIARLGLSLADHVNADTLDAALGAVTSDSPGLRSLRAVLASRRGQYEIAETLFKTAARSTPQPLAAQIQYAYGCDLLRRNRPECAAIFEELLRKNVPGAAHQSEIRSALAQAYVLCERPMAALEQIKFALHVLAAESDDAVVKTRAAYVYFYAAHDLALAERVASEALAQALQVRAYTVAVGAASLVYNIACERDRPREAIAALELLADCGIKLGNVGFQSYAVMAMLEIHVEAGDLQKIAHTMETLRAFDVSYESLATSEALGVAEAMQRSWRGEFASAYTLLEPTASQAVGSDYRALRESQLAFFAAAAHRTKASRLHAERAASLLAATDIATHKTLRARVFLGVAASARGDVVAANRHFAACGEIATAFPRLATVRDGAMLLHQALQGAANTAVLRGVLAQMTERGAGGFALMFDAFPRRGSAADVSAPTTIEPLPKRRPACS